MALANVAISDTFDSWRVKTNQAVVHINNLLEGKHITTGTITSTNTGAAFNATAGYVQVGSNVFSSNALSLYSNTSTLVIGGDGKLGTNVYFELTGTNISDTSANNFTSANVVNTVHELTREAYKTSNGAFYHANSGYDMANAANVLAFNTGIGANAWSNSTFFTIANGVAAFALANNNRQNVIASFIHANASFNKANLVASDLVNTAISVNVYTVSVGTAGNSYTVQVGAAANTYGNASFYTIANGAAAFKHANDAFDLASTLDQLSSSQASLLISSFGHANLAFDKANTTANNLANTATSVNVYTVSVGTAANTASIARDVAGNSYTVQVGAASNTWANTKVSSVTGTSGRITSTGGTTPVIDLATGGAGAATYAGSGVSSITLDAYGRVTAVGSATYLTGITSTLVTNALGFIPYNSSNPSGYITSAGTAALAGGASGGSFFTTGGGAENQVGAALSGYNSVYVYNNSTHWGLYSASGGSLVQYRRSDGKVFLNGRDCGTPNTSTWDISITGSANLLDGIDSSQFVRSDLSSRQTGGVTRLFRRDSSDNYSVQTYWTGSRWRLYGYLNDSGHADTHTGYSDTSGAVSASVAAGSGYDLVYGTMADSDFCRIRMGGNSNDGSLEIATADDGTEPIYVRQYTGVFGSVTRTLTLLDGSGNSTFPGSLFADKLYATKEIYAYTASDITLKENIVPLTNALDRVKQINGVTFDWIDSYYDEVKHGNLVKKNTVGVIAQEVEKVLPEAVHLRDDGKKAVDYEKLVPLLLEAIKELSDKVEKLEKNL